jgi:hypothetical protein
MGMMDIMVQKIQFKKMVLLTIPLAGLIAISSILGILIEDIYMFGLDH